MFGLQKGQQPIGFDLEKDLNGPESAAKKAELSKLITSRVESLKKALRDGSEKEDFERAEILLHGYNALQQVIDKIGKK